MTPFMNSATSGSLTVKLWRGERMCLIGMNVTNPEADFVGFSIELQEPGATTFTALCNRLAFSYPTDAATDVTGAHIFSSLVAPFQKFRWVHFPSNVVDGVYTYRVTKQHMKPDGSIYAGDQATSTISLDAVVYADFLEVGFTRGYASSQAYDDEFNGDPNILPPPNTSGLSFDKTKSPAGVYQWLGYEAYELMFRTLNEVASDPTLSLDMFVYDFDEPDILALLEKIGSRLRIIIDDSGTHTPATSDPSLAAAKLAATAGAANVKRMHFKTLQHNKVLIVKQKDGTPIQVLHGSTNFSFRGLYIQANNAMLFSSTEVATLFSQYFDAVFGTSGTAWASNPLATVWHEVSLPGKPQVQFCFSPHSDTDLSLQPVSDAIDNATSSVFFAIAFLYQSSGTVRDAVDLLMKRNLFSYGVSDKSSSLVLNKPDGSVALVPFAYLADNTHPPFKAEWGGGSGINEHNKFVVVDFNLPTAKVFTGSCNLSPSGESGNGDNLVMIQDQRVAVSYAIQALLLFDHLHFASAMKTAKAKPAKAAATALTLQKPIALSGAASPWFASYYVAGSQAENDRVLFAH